MSTSDHDRFSRALDALVARIKDDRSILAAVLCGSLSHDAVWDKSDIDLVLVTEDDKKLPEQGLALYADGINVHALLMSRTEFRKLAEGSLRSSFFTLSFQKDGSSMLTRRASPRLSSVCTQSVTAIPEYSC